MSAYEAPSSHRARASRWRAAGPAISAWSHVIPEGKIRLSPPPPTFPSRPESSWLLRLSDMSTEIRSDPANSLPPPSPPELRGRFSLYRRYLHTADRLKQPLPPLREFGL